MTNVLVTHMIQDTYAHLQSDLWVYALRVTLTGYILLILIYALWFLFQKNPSARTQTPQLARPNLLDAFADRRELYIGWELGFIQLYWIMWPSYGMHKQHSSTPPHILKTHEHQFSFINSIVSRFCPRRLTNSKLLNSGCCFNKGLSWTLAGHFRQNEPNCVALKVLCS